MRKLVPVLALLLATAGYVLATAGAKPPDFCQRHPNHWSCQTTTTTTVPTTTTIPTTTTVPPPPPTGWPAPLRMAYSDFEDPPAAAAAGFNLIEVFSKGEADATPAGTRGQYWLQDYDNNTCSWELTDAQVSARVSEVANDPKVSGFYFSNEPHPWDCPNAYAQHKARSDLIHSLAPTKYTLIGIDSNDRDHFDGQVAGWAGTADYINYNPYVCFGSNTSTCDYAYEDHVIQAAQNLYARTGQRYYIALQAFRTTDGWWRWPTASEENQMLGRLKSSTLTGLGGYHTFSWDWANDPLPNHPAVLAEISAYNHGQPSPCCSGNPPPTTSTVPTTTTIPTTTTVPVPPGGDPVIAGAGDICTDSTDCAPTAALLDTINPTGVFTLGDNAYDDGTLAQFQDFYDPNWGRFNNKVFPATGNHDYHTAGAAGYFAYFGARAPAPYYSYDLGAWHLIVLASDSAVSNSSGSAEETWLKADLAAHSNACTLAYWHEPRWSSGDTHGNDSSWSAVWNDLYAAHVDVVMNGHEHTYQRFARLNPGGAPDPAGVREFVAGTGGAGLYGFTSSSPQPEVRNNTSHGVLKLTLHSTGYGWEFVPVAGDSFHDSGSEACH